MCTATGSVADSRHIDEKRIPFFHFDADTDPMGDLDPAPHRSDAKPTITGLQRTDPRWIHHKPPRLHCERSRPSMASV